MSLPPRITLESAESVTAIVSLGSNEASAVGDPAQCLLAAWAQLRELGDEVKLSSLYQTAAVDCATGTADFINAIAVLAVPRKTSPEAFLQQLHRIEASFGRVRKGVHNAPRVLDLDLICFGQCECRSPRLTLPHPRATERRFVVEPLAELAPDLVLPGQEFNAAELCDKLATNQVVVKLNRPETTS